MTRAIAIICVCLLAGCIEAPAGETASPVDTGSVADTNQMMDVGVFDADSPDEGIPPSGDMATADASRDMPAEPDQSAPYDCSSCDQPIILYGTTVAYQARKFGTRIDCPGANQIMSGFDVYPSVYGNDNATGFVGICTTPEARWSASDFAFELEGANSSDQTDFAGETEGPDGPTVAESTRCPPGEWMVGARIQFTSNVIGADDPTGNQPREFEPLCSQGFFDVFGAPGDLETSLRVTDRLAPGVNALEGNCEAISTDSTLRCAEVDVTCPAGQVVTGFTYNYTMSIDNFGIICRTLDLTFP